MTAMAKKLLRGQPFCKSCNNTVYVCLVRGDGGVSQQPAGDLREAAVSEGALSVHSKAPQRQRGHLPPAAASRGPGYRPGRYLFHRYYHRHTNTHVLLVYYGIWIHNTLGSGPGYVYISTMTATTLLF